MMMSSLKHLLHSLPVLMIAALLLSGCGIKPGKLEAPQGRDKDDFPHTYPAPKSDDL